PAADERRDGRTGHRAVRSPLEGVHRHLGPERPDYPGVRTHHQGEPGAGGRRPDDPMSLFVLDTDTISFLRKGHPLLQSRVDARAKSELAVTSVTVEEMLTGWYTYIRQATQPPRIARGHEELASSVRYLGGWNILTLTEPAQAPYAQLAALRLNVGKKDLRIAAIALENNAVVVTHNLQDFQRVPGLTVEDWSV